MRTNRALYLFLGGMMVLALVLFLKQEVIPTEDLTAVVAKDLSLKNYDAAKHNRQQVQCLNEVLTEIKTSAKLGWSSVIFNNLELCSHQKQITTIPHLVKELQARGFQVERTAIELKISW